MTGDPFRVKLQDSRASFPHSTRDSEAMTGDPFRVKPHQAEPALLGRDVNS